MAFQPKPDAPEPAAAPGLPQVPGITLQKEIARGGMGVVYVGRQDFLDRRVAVKFLAMDLRSEQFAARFRREAKILAGIKHPNIVACHSAGTTDAGQSYLVMEFVDGPNLKSWIGGNGPLAVPAALRMTRALAGALGHAHEQGVIHRDVKPENILLESATSTQIDFAFPFTPKLVDLGLARMTHESADLGLTSPGSVMGTPATMSPEQFDNPDGVDFRSDIYGLGCVLYEMLSGQPAYQATRLSDLVVQKREPIGPNPCDAIAWLPANVGVFVSMLLASDREQRPHSYDELIERLDALLAECQSAMPPAEGPASTMTPHTLQTSLRASPTTPASSTPAKGSKPPAPGSKPPASKPPASKPPAPATRGPGLLKTAEFEFLAAGAADQASSAPAFQESPEPVSPKPSAAVPVAAAPARSGPKLGRMLVLAAAVLAGVAGGVWFVLHNAGTDPGTLGVAAPNVSPTAADSPSVPPVPVPTPAKPAPKPNIAPAAPIVSGPDALTLNKPQGFVANASDPEGDNLSYRWSSPQSRFVTFAPPDAASTEVRILDGLPNEEFTIEVAVADSSNTPVTTRKVVKVEAYKPRRLLAGFKEDDSPWVLDQHALWVQNIEDGSVSCTAAESPRTCSCPLGAESYWQLVGQLEAGRFNAPTFATTGMRLEFGDIGYTLLCNRTEAQGVKWSIELMQSKLTDGVWQDTPMTPAPLRVEWRDEADEGQFAFFSIKRRLDEVTFQIGCVEQKLTPTRVVTLPPSVAEPRLWLFATGGRGVFREMKMF